MLKITRKRRFWMTCQNSERTYGLWNLVRTPIGVAAFKWARTLTTSKVWSKTLTSTAAEDPISSRSTSKSHFSIKTESSISDASPWCARSMEISKAISIKRVIWELPARNSHWRMYPTDMFIWLMMLFRRNWTTMEGSNLETSSAIPSSRNTLTPWTLSVTLLRTSYQEWRSSQKTPSELYPERLMLIAKHHHLKSTVTTLWLTRTWTCGSLR